MSRVNNVDIFSGILKNSLFLYPSLSCNNNNNNHFCWDSLKSFTGDVRTIDILKGVIFDSVIKNSFVS